MSEKLQKVLARVALGSRREVERWIEQGRVSVDNKPATLGERIETHQIVRLDGRIIPLHRGGERHRVLAYHKPEGEICTRRDSAGRPTIFDHLPRLRNERWVAVGRLDINSAGLLLLTTDGELANRLMHPSHELEREYAVRVLGRVDEAALAKLERGVRLRDGTARFDSIRAAGGSGANRWYHVTLREGRKREVRRMWQAVGARVSRLIRIRYGSVSLPRALRAGKWQELGHVAIANLYAAAGLELHVPVPRKARRARATRAVARPRAMHR
jgi:23S rRNA pseudouridine2605 synthase